MILMMIWAAAWLLASEGKASEGGDYGWRRRRAGAALPDSCSRSLQSWTGQLVTFQHLPTTPQRGLHVVRVAMGVACRRTSLRLCERLPRRISNGQGVKEMSLEER